MFIETYCSSKSHDLHKLFMVIYYTRFLITPLNQWIIVVNLEFLAEDVREYVLG